MTTKERNEKRHQIFNEVYFLLQLGAQFIQTYGDFVDVFSFHMRESSIGECTKEDEQWAMETLVKLEKKNLKQGIG